MNGKWETTKLTYSNTYKLSYAVGIFLFEYCMHMYIVEVLKSNIDKR